MKQIGIGERYPRFQFIGYCYQPFRIAYFPGATADPGIKVNRLIIRYQFSQFGSIAFTVYDRFIQALNLDSLWAIAV